VVTGEQRALGRKTRQVIRQLALEERHDARTARAQRAEFLE
jgi:hypothetical protein